MTYREFDPPRSLANVIECVWTNSPDVRAVIGSESDTKVGHTILPDGAMDVITTFFPDGEIDQTSVVGAMTHPQLATIGNETLVGVRFLPARGGNALGVNAATLTDDQVALAEICKDTNTVREAFRALHLDAKNANVLHVFVNSLNAPRREVPALVLQSTKLLSTRFSTLRIAAVAGVLGVTRQHLTRVFSAHAGLTPKLFAQICRVRALMSRAYEQQLLEKIDLSHHQSADHASTSRGTVRHRASLRRSTEGDSWSQLAAEFGYADQSHLIAEVHAIIGQTPAAWLARSGSNIPIVPVPVAAL